MIHPTAIVDPSARLGAGGRGRAYVALALVPGIGVARLTNLRAACGSWTGALAAPVVETRVVLPGRARSSAGPRIS